MNSGAMQPVAQYTFSHANSQWLANSPSTVVLQQQLRESIWREIRHHCVFTSDMTLLANKEENAARARNDRTPILELPLV